MITIKTEKEIEIMREGGKILAGIMKELEKRVKPGITTKELNRAAEALIFLSSDSAFVAEAASAKEAALLARRSLACPPKPCLPAEAASDAAKKGRRKGEGRAKEDKIKCSFRGYDGYPACLCASINEQIVHGVPSERQLKEGDIIGLDLGIFYKGFHTDMAVTVSAGKTGAEAKKIIEVAKQAFAIGVKEVKPGNHIGDIGYAIQKYVESQKFNVVRELCGHGIGRELHEDPRILNYGKKGTGPELAEGMVLCIEPMVTAGNWRLKKSKDGYGFETADGSLTAHFEHTVAVTKDGYKVLTEME